MYEPGTVLAGKYRIERRLGRGGMGLVLAAEHIELRSVVAIKCLHDAYARRSDVVMRFLREARASARLQSEHVCRVFDVDRLDTGVPYLVMELLHGRDLAQVLRATGPLDPATVAAYLVQACDAIGEAHAAQIVHRDLKPSNLFLTRRRDGAPLIKVLDFGVAKAPEEGSPVLTDASTVVGSPRYMAPEQIRAARIADARSDIWSLGVILYELVSGRPPFEGASLGDLAIRIATEPAEPLRDAPPGFARVVARCLEKDPDRRFQDVGELAHALAACTAAAAPEPVRPDTAGAAIAPPVTPETLETRVVPAGPTSTTLHGASGAVSVARASLTRRGLVSAGVAALLVGAGLAILFGPRYRSASGHGPSAETSAPPPVSAAPATPARLEPAPDPTPIAPPLPPAPPAPVEPAPPPAPAPAAAEAAPPAAAPAVNVDAGASSKPGTSDDKHRRPPPPARRPARAKTKETIGESRI